MHTQGVAFTTAGRSRRNQYLGTASLAAAILMSLSAGAAQAQEADIEEVVVTASRIDRAGFEAPTPTTTVGLSDLQKAGTTNVADYLTTVPAFGAAWTPASSAHNSVGNSANIVNLRSLGQNRTLVLVDRKRFTPSTANGRVDLNVIPTVLIERIEVVTGGASAAWGSDAVAGVVNLIFKKNIDGIQGEVSGGISKFADNEDFKASLAWGDEFLDGRLRVAIASEYQDYRGVKPESDRSILKRNIQVIANPNYKLGNGQPQNYLARNVNVSTATLGGLATTGPFAGMQFAPGGTLAPFTYGALRGTAFMIGGSPISITDEVNAEELSQLVNPIHRGSLYFRSAYDVTDRVEATFEASYAQSYSEAGLSIPYDLGTITIQRDNAYLRPEYRAQLQAANVSSFRLGRINKDISYNYPETQNQTSRFMFGLQGDVDLFGTNWKWDSYVSTGRNRYKQKIEGNRILANWAFAVDAVINPATGQPICRAVLQGNAAAAGCVPINLLGEGAPSAEASRYVTGTPWLDAKFDQTAAAFNFSGEPFSVPAGPVSIAAGVEWRKESVDQVADEISKVNGFNTGNPKAIAGEQTVTEGFVETVIPLMKDAPLVQGLDFNGAVRLTDYKTSGTVTTWKAGLSWTVNDELRFRAARSRDIRAPALGELYASYVLSKGTLTDPTRNNQTYQVDTPAQGNVNLQPETANTTTLGLVYEPSFLPGLSISLDYYNIKLKDAIGTLGAQEIINRCYNGVADLCQYVERFAAPDPRAGELYRVTRAQFNLSETKTSGEDLEVAYNTPMSSLWESLPGDLSLRFLLTHVDELTSIDNGVTQILKGDVGFGHGGIPEWKWNASATWREGPVTLYAALRYTGGGRYDNTKDAAGTYITQVYEGDNWLDGQYITDISAQYILREGDDGQNLTLFGGIKNLFNTYGDDNTIAYILSSPTNFAFYDSLGRQFQLGLRFKY